MNPSVMLIQALFTCVGQFAFEAWTWFLFHCWQFIVVYGDHMIPMTFCSRELHIAEITINIGHEIIFYSIKNLYSLYHIPRHQKVYTLYILSKTPKKCPEFLTTKFFFGQLFQFLKTMYFSIYFVHSPFLRLFLNNKQYIIIIKYWLSSNFIKKVSGSKSLLSDT